MDTRWKKHWVLDCESDGPCPGEFNLISFAVVNVFDPQLSYSAIVRPIAVEGIKEARDVSGISYEEQMKGLLPAVAFTKAQKFMLEKSDTNRVQIWSDNIAYDWMFWCYYTWRFTGQNVAGFSGRRIGDMDAGRRGNPFNTNAWKKWRDTEHTHDPEDDARGNAEALRKIIGLMAEPS